MMGTKKTTTLRITEEQNEEMKVLLREIKEKTGKHASDAIIASLRYFNEALNKVLYAGGKTDE